MVGDIENRVAILEREVKDIKEQTIRNDEKYNTLLNQNGEMRNDIKSLMKTVTKIVTDLAVNNQVTKSNSTWIEGLTVPKIITLIVGILAIISFIKNGG